MKAILWTCFGSCAASLVLRDPTSGLTRVVTPWGQDSLRIRLHHSDVEVVDYQQGDALLPTRPPTDNSLVVEMGTSIINGNIKLDVSADGLATVTRVSDGRVLLAERHYSLLPPQADEKELSSAKGQTSEGSIEFAGLTEDEYVYGFGEQRGSARCTNQCTNISLPIRSWDWTIQHSQDVKFLPNNGNAWIPYYSSSRGYGFLWNHPGYGTVHMGKDATRWFANATQQLDYWVTTTAGSGHGDLAALPPYRDLLRHYVEATGKQPRLPHKYTGFWQCKLRYSSQEQVLRVAREYLRRKLPISVIVIDFHHWAHEGDWRFCDDPDVPSSERCKGGCWPDPTAMVAELKAINVTLAASVWPDVDTKSINYANMSDKQEGMLIRGKSGSPLVSAQGQFYLDAFNPKTRQYVFDQFERGYGRHGINTFWMDATEPQGANIGHWYFKFDDGTIHQDVEVGMAWVQQYHRMAYEGLINSSTSHLYTSSGVATSAAAVPPFLTRSAFAGSQRYGPILWSGDIESTFDELATQVQVAQHVAMSGIYLWTTDIGGFRGASTEDPVFRELIVRWFQFGAFCPIFRLHGVRSGPQDKDKCGSTGFNEVWHFGEEAYQAISSIMRLRESMRGYVQEQLDLASAEGTPALRPMTFDFADVDCVQAVDQFMFGPSYLVAPVLYYKASNRTVYLPTLPSEEQWEYYYDPSLKFAAGSWHTVDTSDLNVFPLFIRKQSTTEVIV